MSRQEKTWGRGDTEEGLGEEKAYLWVYYSSPLFGVFIGTEKKKPQQNSGGGGSDISAGSGRGASNRDQRATPSSPRSS